MNTIILPFSPGTAEIQRLYSLGNLTNHSHACGINEEIILICHGRGSNITWTATSDSIDIGRIIFFNSDREGTIINQGTIRGLLIDTDVNNNLVSELHVFTTPSMRPISITCLSSSGRSSHLIAPPGIYTSDRYLGESGVREGVGSIGWVACRGLCFCIQKYVTSYGWHNYQIPFLCR